MPEWVKTELTEEEERDERAAAAYGNSLGIDNASGDAPQEEVQPISEENLANMDNREVIYLLKNSLEFFEAFFLGDHLDLAVPAFHVENWELMKNPPKRKIATAWPRGYAKSTLAKLFVVWSWLFDDKVHFVTYTSGSKDVASGDTRDIMAMLETPNFIRIFGKPRFKVQQESLGSWQFTMMAVHSATGKLYEKSCILKAYGSKMQFRGKLEGNRRPELGIADDIENDDDVASESAHDKLTDWFFGAYIRAFDRKKSKNIVLGNMLAKNSLIYDLTENSPEWVGRRFGCLTPDLKALWPAMMTVEEIQADYREQVRLKKVRMWFCEMMNMPVASESSIMTTDLIHYVPLTPADEYSSPFITVDPATSVKDTSDDRSVAVTVMQGSHWVTVDYMAGKFTPEQLFMHIVTLCHKWGTRKVGIELNGAQLLFKNLFELYMKKYQFQFQIIAISHHNKHKAVRIASWCALLRTGEWALAEGSTGIVDQLINYDPRTTNNVDDVIDSCAMGVQMTTEMAGDLFAPFVPDDTIYGAQSSEVFETSYEICPI